MIKDSKKKSLVTSIGSCISGCRGRICCCWLISSLISCPLCCVTRWSYSITCLCSLVRSGLPENKNWIPKYNSSLIHMTNCFLHLHFNFESLPRHAVLMTALRTFNTMSPNSISLKRSRSTRIQVQISS